MGATDLTPSKYVGRPCAQCGNVLRYRGSKSCTVCDNKKRWERKQRQIKRDPEGCYERQRVYLRRWYDNMTHARRRAYIMEQQFGKRRRSREQRHNQLTLEREGDDSFTQSLIQDALKGLSNGPLPTEG